MKPISPPNSNEPLTESQIDRIIEMAWEDRTPFDAITFQFGLAEADVKALMKKELKFCYRKFHKMKFLLKMKLNYCLSCLMQTSYEAVRSINHNVLQLVAVAKSLTKHYKNYEFIERRIL